MDLILPAKVALDLSEHTRSQVARYIINATSDNTRKAYRADIRHYERWGGLLPAEPAHILHYLSHHAETLNIRTLERRLIALRQWHVVQGLSDPTLRPEIKKMLKGMKRLHGKAIDKAPALSLDDLQKMTVVLNKANSLTDIRDACLILIGFFGAFRRSELVAIEYEHITWGQQGIEIFLPHSKTDQGSSGQFCALPYAPERSALCPILALKLWLGRADLKQGPIFRRIYTKERVGQVAMADITVSRIIKRAAQMAGLSGAEHYSGHSLRRGLASAASYRDVSLADIMRQGRWRTPATVLGYIEEVQRFEKNVLNQLLNK